MDGVEKNDGWWTVVNSLNYTKYDSMYCGNNGHQEQKCSWWLASPSSHESFCLCRVDSKDACLSDFGIPDSSCSVSPLISLKSDFIPEIGE